MEKHGFGSVWFVCHVPLVFVIGHLTHVTPLNPQSINHLIL